VLEELVENDLRHRVALELDVDPQAALVAVVGERVVAHRNLGDDLALDELGDLLDDPAFTALADAVRKLRDDDRRPTAAELLDVGAPADDDPAPARAVRVADPRAADDDTAGREVWALDQLAEPLDVDGGVVDHGDDPVNHLADVMRRDVRRHPDGDAGGAVDEEVREARRQDRGLLPRLVVVGDEVDRVCVDVAEHLGRDPREPAFRVAHRGRRVAVHRAEVALSLDERVAHRERLGEAHERVVDRLVAVRVVGAHDVTDDAGALPRGAVRLEACLVHRVEHPAVHRLQAVAGVRQRPAHDHAHRVVEEAGANLLLQLARLDAAGGRRGQLRHPGISRPARSAR
jgi:hypothetical protein